MRFILLCTFCLLFTGCADRYKVPSTNIQGFTIQFEHKVSGSDQEFGVFSAKYIIDQFLSDHRRLDPLVVSIAHSFKIYEPNSLDSWFTGQPGSGFYLEEESKVRTIAGVYNTLPLLYHEFCHSMFAKRDIDHEDPRWEEWNERAKEIDNELYHIWWEWDRADKFDAADEKLENERGSKQ